MAENLDSSEVVLESEGPLEHRRIVPVATAAGVVACVALLMPIFLKEGASGRAGYIPERATPAGPETIPISTDRFPPSETLELIDEPVGVLTFRADSTQVPVVTSEPEGTAVQESSRLSTTEAPTTMQPEQSTAPNTSEWELIPSSTTTTIARSTTEVQTTTRPPLVMPVMELDYEEDATNNQILAIPPPTTLADVAPDTEPVTIPTTTSSTITSTTTAVAPTTTTTTTTTAAPTTTLAVVVPETTSLPVPPAQLNTYYGYDCNAASVTVEPGWTLYQMGEGCNPDDPMYLADADYNTDLACDPNTLLAGQVVQLQPVNQNPLACEQSEQTVGASPAAPTDCPQHWVTFTPGPNWTVDAYLLNQGIPQIRVSRMRDEFMRDFPVVKGQEVSLPAVALLYCLYPL